MPATRCRYGWEDIELDLTKILFTPLRKGEIITITEREIEVLRLVAEAWDNPAIADKLFIEVRTVEKHLNNICSKIKSVIDVNGKNIRVVIAQLYNAYLDQIEEKNNNGKT